MGSNNPSSQSTLGSSLPVRSRDHYPLLCTLGPAPSIPEARATALLWRKLSTFKASEFQLQRLITKRTHTLCISCSPFRSPERFSSCANWKLPFHSPSLCWSLLSLQRRGSLPSVAVPAYLPKSHTRASILPGCLLPTVEIILPTHRSISWVF